MPLDPIFAERLQSHRRYLIRTTLEKVRTRLAALLPGGFSQTNARSDAAASGGGTRQPTSATSARTPSPTPRRTPQPTTSNPTTGATRRSKHRRAALSWDRKELAGVGTPAPEVYTEEHTVVVDNHPDVRVRIYYPGTARPGAPIPACLSFFGGAFRIGGIDFPTTDAGFRHRAADSGVAIVAVDYALSPENRFPAPVEQGYAALRWLMESAEALALDSQRIGIAGVSAGANVAAVVTLLNRDRARYDLRFQLLEVPVVDLTGRHIDLAPTRAMRIPRFIVRRELRSVAKTYLGDLNLARTPLASPLLAASHADLPPAFIMTAEYDPLRGDGAAYLAALRKDGVEASAVQHLGVTHDTPIFTGVLPAAKRWHREAVTILQTLHDRPQKASLSAAECDRITDNAERSG